MFLMVENGTPEIFESRCRPDRPSLLSRAFTSAPEGIEDFIGTGVCPVVRIRSSPNLDESHAYRQPMATDPRKVLWQNLATLMTSRWGEVNKRRLAREAEIGETTMKRIVAADDSIGLEVINRLARVFRVPVWCLLKAGAFGDQAEPHFSDTALDIAQMFEDLPVARKPRAYALIVQLLEFQNEGPRQDNGPPSEGPTPGPAPIPQGKPRARDRT